MRKEDIDTPVTMKFGVIVLQVWRMDLVGIQDPVEAYETMTHVPTQPENLVTTQFGSSITFTPFPFPRRK